MSNIKTPLEVIQKGEREFEMYYCLHTVMPIDSQEEVREFIKAQTLALLQALHDELEGKKKEMFVPEGEEMPANVFVQNHSYNDSIQDQQDNLQALIKKIRV
jgi:hypothetical protein